VATAVVISRMASKNKISSSLFLSMCALAVVYARRVTITSAHLCMLAVESQRNERILRREGGSSFIYSECHEKHLFIMHDYTAAAEEF
jgi:hypothetical protein